jgi:hypothetical protein
MPSLPVLLALLVYSAILVVLGLYIGRNNPKLEASLPGSAGAVLAALPGAISAIASDVKALKAKLGA